MSSNSRAFRAAIRGTVSSLTILVAASHAFAGDINQDVGNGGLVLNAFPAGIIVSTGGLAIGSNVSESATGASASASNMMLNTKTAPDAIIHTSFPDSIFQTVVNVADVINSGSGMYVDGNLGVATSASSAATGARAIASVAVISNDSSYVSNLSPMTLSSTLSQFVGNTGDVANMTGGISVIGDLGTAASVSVSASGAVAAAGVTIVNTDQLEAIDVAAGQAGALQIAENRGSVFNGTSSIVVDGSLGDGASAGISAIGAAASISVSTINGTFGDGVNFGFIGQRASNVGSVGNSGTIVSGDLAGVRSSVAISATGAATGVNLSVATSTPVYDIVMTSITGPIVQNAINSGSVTNEGAIQVANLTGTGSSVSISATGAAASVSVSSINAGNLTGSATADRIAQSATNTGTIANMGSLTLSGMAGAGSSASISATGAAAAVSYVTVR